MSHILENLTEIQKEIVLTADGPLLVTAGAGSGKTRVLTNRVAHLVQDLGVPQNRILTITFTNKAAGEMKERIAKMLNAPCAVEMCTFHSFAARFLRRNINHLEGYNTNFSIYSQSDTDKVIKDILAQENYKEDAKKDMHGALDFHIGNYKNNGLTLEEYEQQNCTTKNIEEIVGMIKLYNAKLKKSNALDFDDLLLKCVELLQTNQEVLEKMQNRFNYIMVDEFQDTNIVQYKIVQLLAAKHKNIMVVGDEDQCIYTWRGASIENLFKFKQDFAPVKVFKLEENFRSSKNIIERANNLISQNTTRLNKTLFSSRKDGVIEYFPCYNERAEAQKVVETIYSLMRNLDYKPSDFAILMRLNALSRFFEEQLMQYNIPHIVYGGFKFYERQEVKNIISYLRFFSNTSDDGSLLRIINFPKRGIGDATALALKKIADSNNVPLIDVIKNAEQYNVSNATINKIAAFKHLIISLQDSLQEKGLYEFVDDLIKEIEVISFYKSTKKEEDRNRIENIYSLLGAVKDFADANQNATLANYLETVTLITDLDTEDNTSAVTLATVHSAKGLEFNTVFVVGLEDGIFPSARSKLVSSQMEEERRLMYVAVTRAKSRLYLTSAASRFLHGEVKYMMPSKFVKEFINKN